MTSRFACCVLAFAVMLAPVATTSALAEDSHHPGKTSTAKGAPGPAKKKARKVPTAMMANCPMMQGGQMATGGMTCSHDHANMSGLLHGMMHSMMMGNDMPMAHGHKSRGH